MTAKKLNIFSMQLKLLESPYLWEALTGVLLANQKAIDFADTTSLEAQQSGDDEYIQVVADEQSELVENLVGCCFVACQTYITGVVSTTMTLHATAKKQGVILTSTNGTRPAIVRTASPCVAATPITIVEAIEALANYYKHNDEWGVDWSKASGRSAPTIAALVPLGLVSGSTGNLRTGLKAIGIQLVSLADILRDWQLALTSAYQTELKSFGLL
jgi:hypothetical protein